MQTSPENDPERIRITLALLDSIEQDSSQSHRRLSADLGIALGLTNAYMKRCVRKGLLKVRKANPRYYSYYLTPRGLAEKSRLTAEYLSYSFSFFRQARSVCDAAMKLFTVRGIDRIVLAGASDLAEIARICAVESNIRIVALVGSEALPGSPGLPAFTRYDDVTETFDGVLVTDLKQARAVFDDAVKRFGPDRVVAPSLLGAYRRSVVNGEQE